ncbi:hypothetical protein GA0061070_10541, partial [Kosakonia oryziphila]
MSWIKAGKKSLKWWWGKDYSALKRLTLRVVACGNALSRCSSRTLKSMTADLQSAPFGRSGTPPRGYYTAVMVQEGRIIRS